jgi:hypothetical protein
MDRRMAGEAGVSDVSTHLRPYPSGAYAHVYAG